MCIPQGQAPPDREPGASVGTLCHGWWWSRDTTTQPMDTHCDFLVLTSVALWVRAWESWPRPATVGASWWSSATSSSLPQRARARESMVPAGSHRHRHRHRGAPPRPPQRSSTTSSFSPLWVWARGSSALVDYRGCERRGAPPQPPQVRHGKARERASSRPSWVWARGSSAWATVGVPRESFVLATTRQPWAWHGRASS